MEKKILATDKLRFEFLDPIKGNSMKEILEANVGKKITINYINYTDFIKRVFQLSSGLYMIKLNSGPCYKFTQIYLPKSYYN